MYVNNENIRINNKRYLMYFFIDRSESLYIIIIWETILNPPNNKIIPNMIISKILFIFLDKKIDELENSNRPKRILLNFILLNLNKVLNNEKNSKLENIKPKLFKEANNDLENIDK